MENPENTEFKKVTSEDIPLLKEFIRKLYKHENIIYCDIDVNDALVKLAANEKFGAAWLILNNGIIAGYLIITSAYSIEFKGEIALIDELYIEDKFRGKGLGQAAVQFAEAYALDKCYKAVRLEVELSNEKALKIYRKNGFTEHERYIMTKWINKKK